MGDMGDYWRDVNPALKEESQRKRADNRVASSQMLAEAGISFESKNGGTHLIVLGANGAIIDFWPGTGLWVVRGTNERQRGVRRLIQRLGLQQPNHGENNNGKVRPRSNARADVYD